MCCFCLFRTLDAFFDEYPFLQYNARKYSGCLLKVHKTSIRKSYYAIVVRKNSELTDMISDAIFDLHQQGVLHDLQAQWFSSTCTSKSHGKIQRTLKSFGYEILLLAASVVLSFIILLLELCLHKFLKKGK